MTTLNVFNLKGESVGVVSIDDSVMNASNSPQVLQNAIVAYRANQRSGNHSTLTKGEVHGSGKKPWKQKGTGRARAGYKQSPIWRGGGVVFGPKPRDYSKTMTQKSERAALRLAVLRRINDGALTLIDSVAVNQSKTKQFASWLKAMKIQKGLIVVQKVTNEIGLASRNLDGIELVEARNLNCYQLMKYPRIVVTQGGYADLEKRISVNVETT